MIEQWRPAAGFENSYEISTHGRVAGLERTVVRKDGRSQRVPSRVLKASYDDSGYLYVNLCVNGISTRVRVHILAATTFLGERPDGMWCCHYDDNKTNNHIENLRWDTPGEDMLDLVRNGRHCQARKTSCPAGHDYTISNTRIYRGMRYCRACERDRSQRRRAAA